MIESNKNWYAIYVKSRSEKKVAIELDAAGIDYYLPIIRVLKTWSDRKKWIEEPLFKSYIFVNIDQSEFYKAINIPNSVRYISFEGKAVVIPPQQIEAIKYFLEEINPPQVDEMEMKKGMKVEIILGNLTGLKGELIELNGKERVKIRIDVVNKSITLQIPKNKLKVIK
ncbi:MAG: UpxY family transcription antiterminator [Bacteroidetes bacterium]|nr:UpxY family transcription antiterminator [Bacteroidota bacterium]